ncbi:hypothetical protein LB565_15540 [Mesorhizobium sp. CA14]|nr:hypothetical protein [Mesorhizobium sp. CA14]MBZ9849397.1 hypothetical protein [Mesorhizobium sp. CA14]
MRNFRLQPRVSDVIAGVASAAIAALAVRLAYRENSRLDAFATRLL